MSIKVRRATERDLERINALLYQVAMVHHIGRPDLFKAGEKKYTDEQLIEILHDEDRPIFAAVDENDVMQGYAFCVMQKSGGGVLTDIKTLYIDDICVDEAQRGKHIGTKVYEAAIEYAKEQGCHNVTLNVWECNPTAMAFYKSLGMKPYKTGMEVIL